MKAGRLTEGGGWGVVGMMRPRERKTERVKQKRVRATRRDISSGNSEKRENIKNCDRDGPVGQSMAGGSTVCNAGHPRYLRVFVISLKPIKVSMKKKRRKQQ